MKKMKLGMIITSLMMSVWVQAQVLQKAYDGNLPVVGPSSACVIPRLEGERIPFPLRSANTKFELAENETYVLNGTIVAMNGRYYFKVDFVSQPWLATEKLLQNPYFPIDDASMQLGATTGGAIVQLAVVASKNDSTSQTEGGNSALKLVPILPPSPFSN